MKRFVLLALLLFAAPALAVGSWNVGNAGPNGAAQFAFDGDDAGNAQPALRVPGGEVAITAIATNSAISVTVYAVLAPGSDNPAAETNKITCVTFTATVAVPVTCRVPAGYVLDVDVDTDGDGGSVTAQAAEYRMVGAAAPAKSYESFEACLENSRITRCTLDRIITVPAGANNVITWRSDTSANGRWLKELVCADGGWVGTDDSVVDTASLVFDMSDVIHDGEVVVEGCNIDGAPLDGDTYAIDWRGDSTGNLFRVKMVDNHFGGLGSASSTMHFDSLIGLALLELESNMLDQLAGTAGPWIDFDGTGGGSAGQGLRIFASRNVAVPNINSSGFLDLTGGSPGTVHVLTSDNVWSGGAHVVGQTNAWMMFGGDAIPYVTIDNDQFALATARSIPCLVSTSAGGAGGAGFLKGDLYLGGVNASSDYGAIYCVQGTGYGFETVDLSVRIGSSTIFPGDMRAIAFADTTATLGATDFTVRVSRNNSASGVDRPNLFDRTMFDLLNSEATARGFVELNGGRVSLVNGKLGSLAFGPMIGRTFASLTGVADNAVMTATVPATVTQAACITEDTTGSATFRLKNITTTNLLTAADLACAFRKTDAAATACSGGAPCTAVAQTATLTSTPDDMSIICASTTPATSFQIGPTGTCRNKVNISSCSKTMNALTVSWTPIASVTANLSCTYDTIPTWHPMTQNQALSVGDSLGFRTTAGFGNTPAGAETRILIETRPTN
jgi:hypothetical protein